MAFTIFMGALAYAIKEAVGGTHMDAIEKKLEELCHPIVMRPGPG